jgi:ribosomal protein S18 acetylase RimI-like enzyme
MSAEQLESRRFGRVVRRYEFDRIDDTAVRTLVAERCDLAIIRVPSSSLHTVSRLSALGADPIVADTLVYYSCDLHRDAARPTRGDATVFEAASERTRPQLAEAARAIFAGYRNHYASNPMLDSSVVPTAYTEWALSFVDPTPDTGDDRTLESWIARDGDRVTGFINCAGDGDTYEIVLNGVHPDHRGRGIYGDAVSFAKARGVSLGYRKLTVSTQVDNYAVQRTWANRGLMLDRALNTVHLNLLLSDEGTGAGSAMRSEVFRPTSDGPVLSERLAGIVREQIGRLMPSSESHNLSERFDWLRPLAAQEHLRLEVVPKHRDESAQLTTFSIRVLDAGGDLAGIGHAVRPAAPSA